MEVESGMDGRGQADGGVDSSGTSVNWVVLACWGKRAMSTADGGVLVPVRDPSGTR